MSPSQKTAVHEPDSSGIEEVTVTMEQPIEDSRLFFIARLLFGSVLAFTAIDNLRNLEGRIQYAGSKGAPRPEQTVPAMSASLLLGAVGVVLWRLPTLALAAVVSFLLSVTPVMHDFWTIDDPQERQQEQIQFLKNTALLGAAFAFLRIARRSYRRN
ncbi:DoxX family protein [Halomicrobium urmianum]|uniref:DoxX family protein n=1 Tax=Halomicrobium urmianum TaxID=1586233 RepID=UPI0027E3FCDD|nr:DoxX family protein [Halomicrobium urmianum]